MMKRLFCLLLFALALAAMPVIAQDEPCQDGKERVSRRETVATVTNVSPCGWLLTFKAAKKRQDFRIFGVNGSPDVKVFPPGTTCRWWYDWGGVWTIAVDDVNCTVYVNTIEGDWFKARVRRLK